MKINGVPLKIDEASLKNDGVPLKIDGALSKIDGVPLKIDGALLKIYGITAWMRLFPIDEVYRRETSTLIIDKDVNY